MSKNKHALSSGTFLTDGGLETTLVFHEGIELPHFAAFPLVDSPEGRQVLRAYFDRYLAVAAQSGLGFMIDTPTWRASPDWAPLLGYDRPGLRRAIVDAVALAEEMRGAWSDRVSPIVVNGVVGPRGDGYKNGTMGPEEAADYHGFGVDALAAAGVDLISAMTMTTVGEAVGIARAAKARHLQHAISFTVETDGRLVGGETLREAVERTDAATDGSPAWYMVNCAHPTHFEDALARGEAWTARLGGIRANASTRSHAELDEATELDEGDPADLGRRYRALREAFPGLRVLGGCCGTDHRHVGCMAEAVAA